MCIIDSRMIIAKHGILKNNGILGFNGSNLLVVEYCYFLSHCTAKKLTTTSDTRYRIQISTKSFTVPWYEVELSKT